MPRTQLPAHLRRNAVAYLALAIAATTGTAYAAVQIPDGSIKADKLHKNAVTSTKIKNGSVKNKDLKKPTYVQSTNLGLGTPPAVPDVVSVAAYDFSLPSKGRTSVTVFISTIGGGCDGIADQPTIGLYVDNVPIAGTAANVPAPANDRSIQLTATLPLSGGAHTGRVGITCNGASVPNNLAFPGTKSWTIIQTG